MPIKDGRCPLPEEIEIQSKFDSLFDVDDVLGEWVAYLDETESTEDI